MPRWLISFRYHACFRDRNFTLRREPPSDAVELIDVHPAVYVAETRRQLQALQDAEIDRLSHDNRAAEITRVYGAIEVPDGVLSGELADMLSRSSASKEGRAAVHSVAALPSHVSVGSSALT